MTVGHNVLDSSLHGRGHDFAGFVYVRLLFLEGLGMVIQVIEAESNLCLWLRSRSDVWAPRLDSVSL